MYDKELVKEILLQIRQAAERVRRRSTGVTGPEEFTEGDEGIDKLDAICMMLIAIGESLKNLDKITNGQFLLKYPDVDWTGAKGMRDVISHHYFDLNAEVVFDVCQSKIPQLLTTIEKMLSDLDLEV